MADITTIPITDTLAVSHPKIVANFTACQTCFAGSSAPASPRAGQLWFDTTNYRLRIYNGDVYGWKTLLPHTNEIYGGFVPREENSMASYAFNSSVYFGQYPLKMCGTPVDTTDATTKAYVDDAVDDHVHSGTSGNPSKVLWNYVGGAGTESGNASVGLNSTASTAILKYSGVGSTAARQNIVGPDWEDLTTATVYANANESKVILFGFAMIDGTENPQWRVTRTLGTNTSVVSGPLTLAGEVAPCFAFSNTPTADGSYVWALQVKFSTAGHNGGFYFSHIVVL